jgi:hypothetical protein
MAVESLGTRKQAAFFFVFVTVALDMFALGIIIPAIRPRPPKLPGCLPPFLR